ncbi:hypothetical protein R6Z07F_006293 [Ovis aries]
MALRKREPGAPLVSEEPLNTREREDAGERNAISGALGGNACGVVTLCLLRSTIRICSGGVHAGFCQNVHGLLCLQLQRENRLKAESGGVIRNPRQRAELLCCRRSSARPLRSWSLRSPDPGSFQEPRLLLVPIPGLTASLSQRHACELLTIGLCDTRSPLCSGDHPFPATSELSRPPWAFSPRRQQAGSRGAAGQACSGHSSGAERLGERAERPPAPSRAQGSQCDGTGETWIKEAARVQLTPSRSLGAAPALRGQTAKPTRLVSTGPGAAAGAGGGAGSRGGPVSASDGASSGRISLAGTAARPAAPGSSARGAGDAHGGPGQGGIWGPVPAGAPGPWPPLEPGSPVRPEKPGGGEERAGRSPCPGDVSDPPRAGDAEDPGIPRAAQRPLRRAKGFRPTGLGPAGRNCTRSPHAATDGASRPRPLASPGPTPGLLPLREPGPEDREKGRAAHPSSVARPKAQTCGRPGPSPAEDRIGKLWGWGSPMGRGGRSLPGLRAQHRCCFSSGS